MSHRSERITYLLEAVIALTRWWWPVRDDAALHADVVFPGGEFDASTGSTGWRLASGTKMSETYFPDGHIVQGTLADGSAFALEGKGPAFRGYPFKVRKLPFWAFAGALYLLKEELSPGLYPIVLDPNTYANLHVQDKSLVVMFFDPAQPG